MTVTNGQCDARPTVTFPAYASTKFILLGKLGLLQLTPTSLDKPLSDTLRSVNRFYAGIKRLCGGRLITLIRTLFLYIRVLINVKITWNQYTMKKALRERQTLRTGCSKAEPKMFAPPQTPFPGAWDGQNLISWRWSLPLPTNQVW